MADATGLDVLGGWVTRLLTPSGRLNRRSYGIVGLGCVAAFAALAFLVVALGADLGVFSRTAVVALVAIVPLWGWIVSSIKRLHDIGLSGLVMLFVFTPLAGPVFILLVCLTAPGEGAANRYGSAPEPRLAW